MSIEDQNAGEVIRREVMGTAHVDASRGNATEFYMPLQEATMEHVNYLYYCP
jgi:4-carboxymuconolactone decarboxylase